MDFEITDAQAELVNVFGEFAHRYFTLDNVRQWQRDEGLPDDVCKAFVDEYYRYSALSGADGRSGSLFLQTLITEEMSRVAGASLPFANDIMNLRILQDFAGTSEQAEAVMSEYRKTGRLAFALAVSEPTGGSDTMSMRTNVKSYDGQLVLDGRKTFVVNGEYAPNIMVAAIDKDAPADRYPKLSFWLIPRELDGVSAYPIKKIGQKMLPFSDMVFDNVKIAPEYHLENDRKTGFPQLFHLLEIGRVMVCAQSLGMARAAMEDAVHHASKRRAFGSTIGDFQQIQQMLVDMEVKIRNMRGMVYRAAWSFDRDAKDKRLAVALMKRYVPRAATEVASDALQILGGRGYTDNERVSWIWEDCRGNQISEGTDQIMVRVAAPMIFDAYE